MRIKVNTLGTKICKFLELKFRFLAEYSAIVDLVFQGRLLNQQPFIGLTYEPGKAYIYLFVGLLILINTLYVISRFWFWSAILRFELVLVDYLDQQYYNNRSFEFILRRLLTLILLFLKLLMKLLIMLSMMLMLLVLMFILF